MENPLITNTVIIPTVLDERQIISEFYEFGASRSMIMEAEKNYQPIIMKGIMQKANALNRNGRVYPKAILEREVNKYMEAVRDNSATGELDHPSCQDGLSKILTSKGWKFWKDVTDDEVVATLNIETNEIEYHQIEEKIDQPYKGEMFHFKGKNADQLVTPNHRFLLEDRRGKRFYRTAAELYEYRDNHWKILKKGNWVGNDMEYFTIPGVTEFKEHSRAWHIEEQSKSIDIKADDWFEFMGWYLSEGSSLGVCGGDYESRSRYICKVTQKKEQTKQEIGELFSRLPFASRIDDHRGETIDFVICDKRLHTYLLPLGNSHEKYIPEEMKNASPRLLKILFDAFMKGDGRNVPQGPNGEYVKKSVFSTSQRLILDLQEILLKIGGSGNISEWQPKDRVIREWKEVEQEIDNGDGTVSLVKVEKLVERAIKAENSVKQYNLNISSTQGIYLSKANLKVEKVQYNDRVYCVRVKNGNFYTMRNGKAHWTGNSAVVSLSSVSHKVIDLWWEGDTLYGKVQIAETDAGNTLKGLMKSEIKLGISSRGVGSVKSQGGQDIVQDDFELVAFDFVSSPSTPGAWLFRESKGMRPVKMGDANPNKYDDLKIIQSNSFWKNL